MNLRDPFYARREMRRLDPVLDHERVARLSFEVRFGWPPFAAIFYTVTFARQAAVPSIAEILYRGGGGPSIREPRKRNDDTLVFFGEFFKHGPTSPEGLAFVARLGEIHGRFPITDDDFRYTLDTIIAEGARTSALIGVSVLTPREQVATFAFWRSVGEQMGIPGLPCSYDDAVRRAEAYEAAHWASTVAGAAVATSVLDDCAARWAPSRLRPLAARAISVAFGRELRQLHGLPEPGPVLDRAVRTALWLYLQLGRVLPDPKLRPLSASFGQAYGGCPVPHELGYAGAPRAAAPAAGCPHVPAGAGDASIS